MTDSLARLQAAASLEDRAERTLRVAALLSGVFAAVGSRPVLVGGGAVEIYTRSAYTTRDLDFIAATSDQLRAALTDLGFEPEGRHWLHRQLGIVIEFPATTLAPARAVSIDVDGIELRIIAVEDLIVDRLASWKYWGWDPDGVAALILMAIHTDLDTKRLESRAAKEDVTDALDLLRPLAGNTEPVTDEQLRSLRAGLNVKETVNGIAQYD